MDFRHTTCGVRFRLLACTPGTWGRDGAERVGYASGMAFLRAVLNFVVAGALAGILGVTLMGPKLIEWDNTAGQGDGMCICGITAKRGADTLITYQMRGTAAGAALGLLGGVVFFVKRRKAAPPAAATPA